MKATELLLANQEKHCLSMGSLDSFTPKIILFLIPAKRAFIRFGIIKIIIMSFFPFFKNIFFHVGKPNYSFFVIFSVRTWTNLSMSTLLTVRRTFTMLILTLSP